MQMFPLFEVVQACRSLLLPIGLFLGRYGIIRLTLNLVWYFFLIFSRHSSDVIVLGLLKC